MRLYIDADGCPVVGLTLMTAARYRVPVTLLCDTSHQMNGPAPKRWWYPAGRTVWILRWSTGCLQAMWWLPRITAWPLCA